MLPVFTPFLAFVFNYPIQKAFIIHAAVCNGEYDMNQFFICAMNSYAVHFQKREHHINADPFVNVYTYSISKNR